MSRRSLTHDGLTREGNFGSILEREMEAGSNDGGEILLDITELAANVAGQAWRDEKVDGYLLVVFDLPPLAGRVPLLVDVRGEARAPQSLGESSISACVQHRQSKPDVEVHRANMRFRANGQGILRDEK
jgi:hypothetical protein